MQKDINAKFERFELALDAGDNGFWDMDLDNEKIYFSLRNYTMLGYDPETVPVDKNKWYDLMHPEDRKNILPKMEEKIKNAQTYEEEFRLKCKDGTWKWILGKGKSYDVDENGIPHRALGINIDIQKRKISEEKTKHLNRVLSSIRNVNQLITKEKDRKKLIQRACNILTETRGYYNSWIVLFDSNKKFLMSSQSGLDEYFIKMEEKLINNNYTACTQRAINEKGLVVTENPFEECKDCPLSSNYEGRSGYTSALSYENQIFGLISVSIPHEYACDEEEQKLFLEVAGDIAYSLHNIQEEEKRIDSEKKLAESNAQKRALLDGSPDMIILVDNKLKIKWANKIALEMNPDAVGLTCHKSYVGSDEPCKNCPSARVLKSGELEREIIYHSEVEGLKGDSYWEDIAVPVKDENGNVVEVIEIARNITSRIKMEKERTKLIEALNKRVKEQKSIYNISKLSIENKKDINYFLEEVVNIIPSGWQYPEITKVRIYFDDKVYLSRRFVESEWKLSSEIIVDDKERGSIEIFYVEEKPILDEGPFLNEEKALIKAISSIISQSIERVNIQKALEESEDTLKRVIDTTPSCIFAKDWDGRYIFANQFMADLHGATKADMIGKRDIDFTEEKITTKEEAENFLKDDREVIKNKKQKFILEEPFTMPDGKLKWFQTRKVHLKLKNNDKCMLGVAVDITEMKEAQEEIKLFKTISDKALYGSALTDLKGNIVYINKYMANIHGYRIEELIGKHLSILHTEEQLKIIEKYISNLEEINKYAFTEIWHKRKNGSVFPMLMSGVNINDYKGDFKYLAVSGIDITERKKAEKELKESRDTLVETMSKIIDTRDPYTSGHQYRVGQLAESIAKEMGLSEENIEQIRIASLIHDIGKISIPSEVLNKPTKLTEIEWNLIQSHSEQGYNILKSINFSFPAAKIVLEHHERNDGSGYPKGLKEDQISLEAKIIAVADVVEAMTNHRPYRPALGIDKALVEIEKNKGNLYDPVVVDKCIDLIRQKGFKFDETNI